MHMRGRKPAGPQYVDGLEGSARAKERLKVVLETLAGQCRVQEACRRLGVGEARFHELRQQALAAALAGLEPRPAGRPVTAAPTPSATEVAALRAQVAELEVAVRAAQTREEIALVLPRAAEASGEEKKTRRRTSRRGWPRRRAAAGGTGSGI
jgi:hypothetical protein